MAGQNGLICLSAKLPHIPSSCSPCGLNPCYWLELVLLFSSTSNRQASRFTRLTMLLLCSLFPILLRTDTLLREYTAEGRIMTGTLMPHESVSSFTCVRMCQSGVSQ